MSEATIPIKELMEKTEQWLLGQGYKKSTLGFYRATWNRFLSYSASPAYSRETAEQFLLQYFGVDVHAIDQTLDGRMRHARRHMNALDEIFRTGTVCRRKVYGVASIDDDCFDKFFSDYLSYCKMQNFSRSWMDNTIAALRLFLLAVLPACRPRPSVDRLWQRCGVVRQVVELVPVTHTSQGHAGGRRRRHDEEPDDPHPDTHMHAVAAPLDRDAQPAPAQE